MNEGNFSERSENDLARMSDEDLVAYMRAARDAGRHEAAKTAIGVLAWRYWDTLVGRAALKVPLQDAESIASDVTASAIASVFDGDSPRVFNAWLQTILERRIADYHRKREGKPGLSPLPTEHEGDEDVWGAEPSEGFGGDAFHARQCVELTYAALSHAHREVVDLHVLGPDSAMEAANKIAGMTEDNIHQIASRFRRDFTNCLESDDDTSGPQ